MLAKIENVYLSILRVVILVSATGALIVAAFGFASSIPSMLLWVGISQPEEASGGGLSEFMEEQNAGSTEVAEGADGTETLAILPDITSAASMIYKYLAKQGNLSERDWRIGIQRLANEFVLDDEAYGQSVLRLAEELKASKGKPLSEEKVLELINWNTDRFRNDLEAKRLAEAQEVSEFWVKLAAAGSGFLAFIGIVFIFLFVKIERNLRPLREVVAEYDDGIEAQ